MIKLDLNASIEESTKSILSLASKYQRTMKILLLWTMSNSKAKTNHRIFLSSQNTSSDYQNFQVPAIIQVNSHVLQAKNRTANRRIENLIKSHRNHLERESGEKKNKLPGARAGTIVLRVRVPDVRVPHDWIAWESEIWWAR